MSNEYSKVFAENRKARFNFFIEDTYEAGLVLHGNEVKSIRIGRINLKDSYAKIKSKEVFIYQMHIGNYPYSNDENYDPLRPRKLLLHKYEIERLFGKIYQRGFSLIPLRIYMLRGRFKMLLGLGKGKRFFDKRHEIKKRDEKRELERNRDK